MRRRAAAILSLAILIGLGACGMSGAVGRHVECPRPYSSDSPWNTLVPSSAGPVAASRQLVGTITQPLTSDPTQYTYPVYVARPGQARLAVRIHDVASIVISPRRLHRARDARVRIPIPRYAQPAEGGDGQVIVLDPRTHDEWGFWQFDNSSGQMGSVNGYRYNDAWGGVPPSGFGSRGAGVPYLAGLVRPCEIANGDIEHALALAYPNTTWQHVYPATKSDGHASPGQGMAEGTRLQLDPHISDEAIRSKWGCRGPCFTIAKALQRYGMYVIDTSGRSKIIVEYQGTAHWHGRDKITASTVSPIPVGALRVVKP